jgi:hypothetical protein
MVQVNVVDFAEKSLVDAVTIQIDSDGFILLSTLRAKFPEALGLKFKPDQSATWCELRVADEKLYPAEGYSLSTKAIYVIDYGRPISALPKVGDASLQGDSERNFG